MLYVTVYSSMIGFP